jgi:hypothetical protein
MLLAEFNAYLDRPSSDPNAEMSAFRRAAVWLTRAELTELQDMILKWMQANQDNGPSPGRSKYLVTPIVFPIEEGGGGGGGDRGEAYWHHRLG